MQIKTEKPYKIFAEALEQEALNPVRVTDEKNS